jgi:phosphatidylethanolamine-binding protein
VGKHDPKPGDYIPKAGNLPDKIIREQEVEVDKNLDAQSPPELSFQVPDPSKTYMLVALDIDSPFPSLNVLGPILHCIQPGLLSTTGSLALKATDPFVADYIGPAPPPGSSPHRYVFLYEQPVGFEGKKYALPNGGNLSNFHRMRYSLDAWLGPVLAVNYFKSN